MSDFISRGFGGGRREREEYGDRLPPGQYVEHGWPVLTAGPTPQIEPDDWSFRVDGMVGSEQEWSADAFKALPQETITRDIHCVTKWSKFDAAFGGVSLDVLLEEVDPKGDYAMQYSYGGYTTNVPLADLRGGKAWIVTEYDGEPLPREHGGPARMLIPHLYFWKSAKWISGLRVMDHDEPGFWELNGYHNYGDPWKEQRYWTD
jgi:DMSO/TMAO reductase YedYZ molybdopterin-dependent catalytic subunit